jgi:tetratricopeptide (TPR) repeat protein
VARALEAVYGRRVDEHAAELAEHYSNSSDPQDLQKAVQYGEIAAQRALAVFAYGEGARHLQQALKAQEVLDPDDRRKRCELLLSLGEAILPGDEPSQAIHLAAEEAFLIGEALGDGLLSARAAILAVEALYRTSPASVGARPTEEGQRWLERADRSAPAGTPPRVYADAYVGMYSIQTISRERGHDYLCRAVATARQLDDGAVFFAAAGLALWHLQALRDVGMRHDLAIEALHRDRGRARTADLANCLLYAVQVFLAHAELELAREAWTDLGDLAARSRDVTVSTWAASFDVQFAFLEGRLEEAVALWESSKAAAEAAGLQTFTGGSQAIRSLIYLGRTTDAESLYPPGRFRPQLAMRANLLAHLGRTRDAIQLFDEFKGIDADDDASGVFLLSLILEASVLANHESTMRALVRRMTPLVDDPCEHTVCTSIGRLLGSASRVLGDHSDAREYYSRALAASERIRFRPEVALIHLELSELLLEHYPGERPAAIEHLDFAIGEFREMKMQPSLERALRHKEVLKA